MTKQKRMLVVVDPTASVHPAIERAAWLARHLPARIELFVSDYAAHLADSRPPAAAGTDARAAVLERHRRRLEQLAEPLRAAGHHGRLRRALGLPAARQHRPKVRRLRRRHRDQGHALPLRAAALDLLEHRLEPDPRMRRHTVARQTAAAGPTAMLRRRRRSAARARQARGSRPADTRRLPTSSARHSAARCTSSTRSTYRPPLPSRRTR